VPLCCFQADTSLANRTARLYARQVTWWATAVEAVSAFNRLHREQALTAAGREQALARLDHLRRRWHEVQPTDTLRDEAERLLAAALTWCGQKARGRRFVGSDGKLTNAAETEGFSVVRLS